MHSNGIPKMDKSIINHTLTIGDKIYSKGIGTHAVSDIVYSLKKRYRIFTTEVGLDGYTLERKNGSSVFKVYGDGKLLWESNIMHYFDSAQKVKINISGVDRLRLHVGDAGDGNDYDYANWVNAKIIR
jgi:alpha-galactosidase